MDITIQTNWPREEVEALIGSIPEVLSGNAPDPLGIADGFKARLAAGFMGQVEKDYDKQEGGTQSGRLRASLAKGTLTEAGADASYHPPNDDQYYDASKPGEVCVGTNVEYAQHVHRKRPLWPEDELPGEWQDAIMDQARTGIQKIVEMIQ